MTAVGSRRRAGGTAAAHPGCIPKRLRSGERLRAITAPGARFSNFLGALARAHMIDRGQKDAARHADPRTTTVYDRRRQNFDRHAAYAVVAFVTSG